MSAPIARSAVLALYRDLLRGGKTWKIYNVRHYILRRTREKFRELQYLTDPLMVNNAYREGMEELQVVLRQGSIQNMYHTKPIIVELKPSGTSSQSHITT